MQGGGGLIHEGGVSLQDSTVCTRAVDMDVNLIWFGALYLAHAQSITHAAPGLTI